MDNSQLNKKQDQEFSSFKTELFIKEIFYKTKSAVSADTWI